MDIRLQPTIFINNNRMVQSHTVLIYYCVVCDNDRLERYMKKSKKVVTLLIVMVSLLILSSSAYAATFETEPNNTYDQANSFMIGDVFIGQTSSSSDYDYCQFSVGTWSTVNILFLPQPNETADFNFFIWDYTTGALLVSANTYNPGQVERYSFSGTPGHVYRVGIVSNKASDYTYQFSAYL